MDLRPLAPACGAEISGVDLRALSDSEIAELRYAAAERGVVMIRGQSLTREDHIAFARRIGNIVVNKLLPATATHPEIAEVRKAPDQKANIGGGWHTDHSYDIEPAMGSILVARTLPPEGGDTIFAHMGAVFDVLPNDMKARLAGLRAHHSFERYFGKDGVMTRSSHGGDLKGSELALEATHPAVIRHPDTGRQIVYVNPAFTTHFEGLDPTESKRLLNELFRYPREERFQCALKWEPGSVAIWDNRTTWHRAMNDYHGHTRTMDRITIAGAALGG